jgi:hypothetical protein
MAVLINIVTEEQAHVQTVGAVAQQLAVAIDVVEISHQDNFEENYLGLYFHFPLSHSTY